MKTDDAKLELARRLTQYDIKETEKGRSNLYRLGNYLKAMDSSFEGQGVEVDPETLIKGLEYYFCDLAPVNAFIRKLKKGVKS